MPRLYLLTDCAGSWPFVTEDELAESLAGGAVAAWLVGIFEDDSEGWMRLGDEITRVVEDAGAGARGERSSTRCVGVRARGGRRVATAPASARDH